jgi:hypothetical protein
MNLKKLADAAYLCGRQNGHLSYWSPYQDALKEVQSELLEMLKKMIIAERICKLVDNEDGLCEGDGDEFDAMMEELNNLIKEFRS